MPTAQKKQTRQRGPKYGPRVLIGGHFHPDVQAQLRHIAAANDTNIQRLLIEALNFVFKKYKHPQIAGVMPDVEARR